MMLLRASFAKIWPYESQTLAAKGTRFCFDTAVGAVLSGRPTRPQAPRARVETA
jgi:hypothetical protein